MSGTVLSGNILQFGTVLSGTVLSGTVLSGHASKNDEICCKFLLKLHHKLQKIDFEKLTAGQIRVNLSRILITNSYSAKAQIYTNGPTEVFKWDQKRQSFFGMFREWKLIKIDLMTPNIVTMLENYSRYQKSSKSRDIAFDEK